MNWLRVTLLMNWLFECCERVSTSFSALHRDTSQVWGVYEAFVLYMRRVSARRGVATLFSTLCDSSWITVLQLFTGSQCEAPSGINGHLCFFLQALIMWSTAYRIWRDYKSRYNDCVTFIYHDVTFPLTFQSIFMSKYKRSPAALLKWSQVCRIQ